MTPHNEKYEMTMGIFILLNAAFIGYQVEHTATTGDPPKVAWVLEVLFCVVFTLELLYRFWQHPALFFTGTELSWNVFDLFVVSTMVVEQITRLGVPEGSWLSRFSILRTFRLV